MLALKRGDEAVTGRHIWRWNLQFGVGGARQAYQIDALGSQNISVPLEALEVSLVNESIPNSVYQVPDYQVTAYAYVARGDVASDPARYTAFSDHVAAGDFEYIYPPNGATGFRVHGDAALIGGTGTFASPLTADVSYALELAGGLFVDSWYGDQLSDLHAAGGFIPVIGGSRRMTIRNNGLQSIEAAIVWQIDF